MGIVQPRAECSVSELAIEISIYIINLKCVCVCVDHNKSMQIH